MKSKYIWLALSLLTFGALLCAVLIPSVAIMRSPAYKAQASMYARQPVVALMTYSISGGEPRTLPDNLYQLEALDIDYDITKYRDPESGVYYDWLYFGRGVTPAKYDELDPEFILIAVPTLFNNKGLYPEEGEEGMRVVAYMNGTTGVIPEEEFIERIKKQRVNIPSESGIILP